jgi:hypothetical protein
MTTTYKTVDYETHEALRDAINTELETLAYPYPVKHRMFGEGQLTFVKAPWTGTDLYATIDFTSGTKMISLDVVFATKLLVMPEALADILLEAQTAFKADYLGRVQEKREADRLADLQAREAQKKAEEEKKAEAKYKQQKEKAIRDFDKLAAKANELSDVDEFYFALGWLASHAGTVSAALPDYLANSFAKHFGSDAPCRIVDSKKKGPAGYTSQWSWSFAASLKNPDTMPALLTQYLNPTGKSVTDTSFVWDLVDNYGFQFGKKQDIDKIRQTIPNKFMSSFEAGIVA